MLTVDPAKRDAFIVLELLDPDQQPVAGAAFAVQLPNGQRVTGNLDPAGKVRIEGIDPGTCIAAFPHLDRRSFA